MGSHREYSLMVDVLLRLKEYWIDYEDPKMETFKAAFKSLDYDPENVVTNKEIAALSDLPRTTVNKYLRTVYDWLMEEITYTPINVKTYKHLITIRYPYDEQDSFGKSYKHDDREVWIAMNLPVTPRIGDDISFDLFEQGKYYRGTVFDVKHDINGIEQEIHVDVHPTMNLYHKWEKLKDEHRWRTTIRSRHPG